MKPAAFRVSKLIAIWEAMSDCFRIAQCGRLKTFATGERANERSVQAGPTGWAVNDRTW